MNRCGVRINNIFFILLITFAFIPMVNGEGAAAGLLSSRKDKTMLIVPARPGVLRLAFDLAKMRDITLVAFRDKAGADKPLLHVWAGNTWQYVSFDDFRSLRFVEQAPGTVIVIGDDQTVPKTLLQGMIWAGKESASGGRRPDHPPRRTAHSAASGRQIERLPTVNVAELINGINPYFKFNSREWKQLADSYGLKLKGVNASQSKQLRETDAIGQEESETRAATPVAPAEKSAPVFSDNQMPEAARQKPDDKFRLHLGEDEYFLFIWIAPLSIWVGQYETSNAQYSRFNRAHDPKRYYDNILDMPDQPAVMVSWEDANNYCGWLNRNFPKELPPGFNCRLPTEKEWAVFAACGREVEYPWGNGWPPPDALNYKGIEGASIFYSLFHSEQFIRDHNDGFIVAAPVGKSGANEWGLYGVGGNVWEWCRDWFDATKTKRVLRGAAWNNYEPAILAVNNRSGASPEKSNAMIGFRVVIAPQKKR
ncbi:MAG: SUMF1/EgtB/PvdO family nonheme iron enzyme [Kiritimatiellia bacterium]|nr:SUMF1/EgtB/PvdO family nonheme iron enzyme [Kiritimatiellia bacterium]